MDERRRAATFLRCAGWCLIGAALAYGVQGCLLPPGAHAQDTGQAQATWEAGIRAPFATREASPLGRAQATRAVQQADELATSVARFEAAEARRVEGQIAARETRVARQTQPVPDAPAAAAYAPAAGRVTPAYALSGMATRGGWTAVWLVLAAGAAWLLRRLPPHPATGVAWGCATLVLGLPLAVSALVTLAFAAAVAPGGWLLPLLSVAGLGGAWGWQSGRLLPLAGWLDRTLRPGAVHPRDWIVPDLLPCGPRWKHQGYVAILGAAPGTGKSFLLVLLAVCTLLGRAFLGMPVRRLTSVLYADFEMDADEFWYRVGLVCAGLGLTPDEEAYVRRGLHYLNLKDFGEALYVPTADEAARGQRAAGQERIRGLLARHRAQLVLVDSLSYGGGAAPSDQAAWSRILLPPAGMESWGPPVLTIDHVAVRNGAAKLAGGENKYRIARSIFLLERTAPGVLRVTHEKASFGKQQPAFPVRLEFVEDAAGATVAVAFDRLDAPSGATTAATKGVARPGKAPEEGDVPAAVVAGGGMRHPSPGDRPQGIVLASPSPLGERGRAAPPQGMPPGALGDAAGDVPLPPPPPPVPLPRPVLRLVPAVPVAAPPIVDEGGALRGHAAIDAKVLAAVAERGGTVDKAALAGATGYAPKTVANALARLRKAGSLPRPQGAPVAGLDAAEGAAG